MKEKSDRLDILAGVHGAQVAWTILDGLADQSVTFLDAARIRSCFRQASLAYVAYGHCEGNKRAVAAAKACLKNMGALLPLGLTLRDAIASMAFVRTPRDFTMAEYHDALSIINANLQCKCLAAIASEDKGKDVQIRLLAGFGRLQGGKGKSHA